MLGRSRERTQVCSPKETHRCGAHQCSWSDVHNNGAMMGGHRPETAAAPSLGAFWPALSPPPQLSAWHEFWVDHFWRAQVGQFCRAAKCLYAGIPRSTLTDWRKTAALASEKGGRLTDKERAAVEFLAKMDAALVECEVRDVAIIAAAASEHWKAAAWKLERRFPSRWGKAATETDESCEAQSEDHVITIEVERG